MCYKKICNLECLGHLPNEKKQWEEAFRENKCSIINEPLIKEKLSQEEKEFCLFYAPVGNLPDYPEVIVSGLSPVRKKKGDKFVDKYKAGACDLLKLCRKYIFGCMKLSLITSKLSAQLFLL